MDNLRGILLMVASMLGFALEDMFIKWTSADMPTGQILVMLSVFGTPIFAALVVRQGVPLLSRDLLHPAVLARNVGEMVGTFGFITAITLTPLTSATAIFQATPLVVTLGAAVLFHEEVGWQRWLAMAVGFAGVMIVIRPGLEGFEPASLWAVLAVLGLSVRDVSTRRVPPTIVTMHLAFSGFVAVGVLGAGMLLATGGVIAPTQQQLAHLFGALVSGIASYWAITEAMRIGEVSVVTPFRYSRLIFALVIGVLAFHERPDLFTLLGATLIITSGLYTLNRERQRRRDSRVPG